MAELEALRAQLEAMQKELDESKTREQQALLQLGEARQQAHEGEDDPLDDTDDQSNADGQDMASPPPPTVSSGVPVYVSTRRIERFRDRPKSTSDVSVQEFVSDMKSYLASHPMTLIQQTAVVMGHLAGRARQEIEGRGSTVKDPSAIFSVLLTVFGDGDSLGQLRTKFYGYQQSVDEDLLGLSLVMVSLYRRMEDLDPDLSRDRDRVLKERLAEAVSDESLCREMRRLNMESTDLSFFDMRDRAERWMGSRQGRNSSAPKKTVSAQETPSQVDPLLQMLQEHQKLLKDLSSEVKSLKQQKPQRYFKPGGQSQSGERKRLCYVCDSPEHICRDCPLKGDKLGTTQLTRPTSQGQESGQLNQSGNGTGLRK